MSVLSFEDAYGVVQQRCSRLSATAQESVLLFDSLNRVLAEALIADRDFPPFPRAARDGYAVRASDARTIPALLHVVGQVKAGGNFDQTVTPGQAVQIMTGASIPQGADAIVMVECTQRKHEAVEILRQVAPGENIVPEGSEARAGQEIVAPGARLAPASIAVAAAVGKSKLQVHRKPKVGVLATGDELVDVAAPPSARQIRNSNTYSLSAQVAECGGEPSPLPVAPDEKTALTRLIQQGLSTDLLLLSGGVSMGEFDLVEQVLTDLGAVFFFTGVQIQPGRPIVFGEAGSTPFFGLPGNPVSTMVTFDLFVRPVIHALSGATPVRLPGAKARLAKDIRTRTGLTRFLPALLSGSLYDPLVELIPWRGSGDIAASARANCYAVIPPDRELIGAGEMISILLRTP